MRALITWTLCGLAAPALAVERGYAPVDGLQLYYEIHGKPGKDGVPLLLLHGGGSTIETSFGKLIPLVSRSRQVIAFEQQGHGHTADVDRPFSFEQSAEDAVALLRMRAAQIIERERFVASARKSAALNPAAA